MTGFTYNGISTDDYDLMIVTFETLDKVSSGLQREVIKGESNEYRMIANHFGTKWTEVIQFSRTLIKKDFSTFNRNEISKINRWLTSPKRPKYLRFTVDGNDIQYQFCGLFTNITYEYGNGGIIGLTFDFTNNSPFAYQYSEMTYESLYTGYKGFDNTHRNYIYFEKFDIYDNNTDSWIAEGISDCLEDYIYPTLELTFHLDGQTGYGNFLYIYNQSDDNNANCSNICLYQLGVDAKYVIDCKNNIATSNIYSASIESHVSPLINIPTHMIKWLRLLPDYNKIGFYVLNNLNQTNEDVVYSDDIDSYRRDGTLDVKISCYIPKKITDLSFLDSDEEPDCSTPCSRQLEELQASYNELLDKYNKLKFDTPNIISNGSIDFSVDTTIDISQVIENNNPPIYSIGD